MSTPTKIQNESKEETKARQQKNRGRRQEARYRRDAGAIYLQVQAEQLRRRKLKRKQRIREDILKDLRPRMPWLHPDLGSTLRTK